MSDVLIVGLPFVKLPSIAIFYEDWEINCEKLRRLYPGGVDFSRVDVIDKATGKLIAVRNSHGQFTGLLSAPGLMR